MCQVEICLLFTSAVGGFICILRNLHTHEGSLSCVSRESKKLVIYPEKLMEIMTSSNRSINTCDSQIAMTSSSAELTKVRSEVHAVQVFEKKRREKIIWLKFLLSRILYIKPSLKRVAFIITACSVHYLPLFPQSITK